MVSLYYRIFESAPYKSMREKFTTDLSQEMLFSLFHYLILEKHNIPFHSHATIKFLRALPKFESTGYVAQEQEKFLGVVKQAGILPIAGTNDEALHLKKKQKKGFREALNDQKESIASLVSHRTQTIARADTTTSYTGDTEKML